MLRKLGLTIIALILFTGCNYPPTETDGFCALSIPYGKIYINQNNYDDITMERYSIVYENGVLYKTFDSNITVPYLYHLEDSNTSNAFVYYDPCNERVDEFSSFLVIAHLDDNRTYTIAGFTKEIDQEHNITGGKDVDVYNIGYIQDHKYHSLNPSSSWSTQVDITQTGEFTFSAGR